MSDKTNKTHRGFAYDGGINGGSVIRPLSEGIAAGRTSPSARHGYAAPGSAAAFPSRSAPATAPTKNGPQDK